MDQTASEIQLITQLAQSLASRSESTKAPAPATSLEKELEVMLKGQPPFIRPPKPKERCPLTGMSRTTMMELITPCRRNGNRPPIKAVLKLSSPIAKRGMWMIPTRDLLYYLLKQREASIEVALEMRRRRDEETQPQT
ncbi:MAG TPA: hypothetical protein VIM58_06010 [Candidatus Methylacidiphilales bacterium]